MTTAIAELREETGLVAAASDLVAFASVSEPEVDVLRYPNGDVTHAFALWFLVERFTGELVLDGEETTELGFYDRAELPEPLAPASLLALELHDAWCATGRFQAR